MKTKVFFFSLLMGLVMVGNVQSAYAEDFEIPENQTGPIILTQEGMLDGSDDRGVVIIPLEAYYQGETIFLDFTYNVGNVEVSVRNTTTGNCWSGTLINNGMIQLDDADNLRVELGGIFKLLFGKIEIMD